jgi:hypothetical protein
LQIKFEHDFQQKIMLQVFTEPTSIESVADVNRWRSTWMQELKSWHSPYKCIVDCSNLKVTSSDAITDAFNRMIKFFEGLFLKTIVVFSDKPDQISTLPFEKVNTFEEAQTKVGVRGMRSPNSPVDFRANILIQNHFAQHVVELSFAEDEVIGTKEQMLALKSKLTNNLMQWHSKWSLLLDCSKIEFDSSILGEWEPLNRYFTSFFMKAVVGYSPKGTIESYPFKVYRSRHKAVAGLEAEGLFMGNDAHCRSSKAPK